MIEQHKYKLVRLNIAIVAFIVLFFATTSDALAERNSTFRSVNVDQQDEIRYDGPEMARFVFLMDARDRKNALVEAIDNWPQNKQQLWYNITRDRGTEGLVRLISVFLFMLAIGFFIERLISLKTDEISNKLAEDKQSNFKDNLNYSLLCGVFKFLGIGIFSFVAGGVAAYSFDVNDPSRIICLSALILVVKIRALSICLKLVLAPDCAGNRLLNVSCVAAKQLYNSIFGFMAVYLIITSVWRILGLFSLEPILFSLLVPLTGFILNILSIGFIWYNHKIITGMFVTSYDNKPNSTFMRFFVQVWPTLSTLWLLVVWSFWALYEFLGYYDQADKLTPVWWLTFTFPILDRLVFIMLSQIKRVTWLKSHSFDQRCDKFIRRVIIALRFILLAVVLYLIDQSFGTNTWDMLTSKLGGFLQVFVDVIVVIIFAYAIWEIIQSAIERHLPYDVVCNENENGLATLEGDGGGSGASRSETLLPLVRSFLLVFLIATVTLTILSIMGVEIAPLLAGAGIVGIAVGFGAQKLVQDVISGIFFLLDDAFRRGEYIEAAGLRGTVERISIRSITLRHHLGAVQTIPFSEIATVRNLSRDWITMKLEFRLDYRTDVEVVRKLIKKVGQKMLDHPEYGAHFLLPLKSQGVIRVEESALIFRMKFTCVPGEQWVIRREAFRLVKESLKSKGIEFAHRSVHVLMQTPDQPSDSFKEAIQHDDELKGKLAGAASSVTIPTSIQDTIKQHDKLDFD